ncbi:MAG: HAMP domain-containing protein [Proteobacteria bacterium]|nr:HAMP domain-containing protein [Pseudomonadota bacterium]
MMDKKENKRGSTTLSIRAQLTAGIVIITLAGIGLIGLFALKVLEGRSIDSKVRQAVTLVDLIRVEARHSALPGSASDSTIFVYEVFKELGVADYELKAADSTVLLSEGKLPVDKGAPLFLAEGIKVYKFGGGLFAGPGERLFVTARLDRATVAKGSLSFTLPMDDIKREVAGVRLFLLLYAVVDSVIIILFGVYFFSRSISRPIKGLEEATTRIASGAFDERVDISVDNEVGRLAASFNTMAERIESEIVALESVNSKLVSTQEELLRTSTLAALGRMAAGIAHEVGNPLGAVQGYLEILGAGESRSEEEQDIIRRTTEEVARIDKILREFLDVARPSPARSPGSVDVNSVVQETVLDLSAHKDMALVTVRTSFGAALPAVAIDPDRLRQVLVNLLLNAAHSMDDIEGERVVSVETSLEKRGEKAGEKAESETDASMPLRRRDDRRPAVDTGAESIAIRITDHGRGVDAESAKKIFEPFFSTKEVGHGTGLGLFVSDMIIKAHRGSIAFDSAIGTGSTFTVILPSGKG